GGRRHRRDRARAAVAVAAWRRRASGRRHTGRLLPARARAAQPAGALGRPQPIARRQPHQRGDRRAGPVDACRRTAGVPDIACVRTPALTCFSPSPSRGGPGWGWVSRPPPKCKTLASLVSEITAAEPKPIPSQTLPLKGRASQPRFKAPRTDAMKTQSLQTADQLNLDWSNNPRWNGITRKYCAEDVVRLRGTVHVAHSLARLGAEKLWKS